MLLFRPTETCLFFLLHHRRGCALPEQEVMEGMNVNSSIRRDEIGHGLGTALVGRQLGSNASHAGHRRLIKTLREICALPCHAHGVRWIWGDGEPVGILLFPWLAMEHVHLQKRAFRLQRMRGFHNAAFRTALHGDAGNGKACARSGEATGAAVHKRLRTLLQGEGPVHSLQYLFVRGRKRQGLRTHVQPVRLVF